MSNVEDKNSQKGPEKAPPSKKSRSYARSIWRYVWGRGTSAPSKPLTPSGPQGQGIISLEEPLPKAQVYDAEMLESLKTFPSTTESVVSSQPVDTINDDLFHYLDEVIESLRDRERGPVGDAPLETLPPLEVPTGQNTPSRSVLVIPSTPICGCCSNGPCTLCHFCAGPYGTCPCETQFPRPFVGVQDSGLQTVTPLTTVELVSPTPLVPLPPLVPSPPLEPSMNWVTKRRYVHFDDGTVPESKLRRRIRPSTPYVSRNLPESKRHKHDHDHDDNNDDTLSQMERGEYQPDVRIEIPPSVEEIQEAEGVTVCEVIAEVWSDVTAWVKGHFAPL